MTWTYPSMLVQEIREIEERQKQLEAVQNAAEENIQNIKVYVTQLKERVAKLQYQKQHLVCQLERNDSSSIGPDIIEQSPQPWPLVFENQRKQIVMLWHLCHVPLVHHTQFFLLFQGDPSYQIYMEDELFCGRQPQALSVGHRLNQKRQNTWMTTLVINLALLTDSETNFVNRLMELAATVGVAAADGGMSMERCRKLGWGHAEAQSDEKDVEPAMVVVPVSEVVVHPGIVQEAVQKVAVVVVDAPENDAVPEPEPVAVVHEGVLEIEVVQDLEGQQKEVHVEVTMTASSEDQGNKLEAEMELGVDVSFETVAACVHSTVDLVADVRTYPDYVGFQHMQISYSSSP
ncbi:hypothetical protein MLD38_016221 [Melastoma candidum]|uniref:Uncharacterized protein n=1 Tax=Melastoma candidum TaxID=119954 RepID=A0ACB9RIS5_9MYRT|nr:hypothetical protein MLD38_016221 [Melastoma candidum]